MTKYCKYCEKDVVHIFSRETRVVTSRRVYTKKVYVDAQDRYWSAAKCPDCTGDYSKKRNRRLRKTQAAMTKRICSICNKHLPADRRFLHKECSELASSAFYDIHSYYDTHF